MWFNIEKQIVGDALICLIDKKLVELSEIDLAPLGEFSARSEIRHSERFQEVSDSS